MNDKAPRVVITLRAPTVLKDRLDAHAARLGVSVNAAVLTLLDEALRAAKKEVR
jgi:predicted HicB family RNase H-like nuclease